ncbi:hypothetical protein Micbo1qcDRAFT_208344 [Microdochium bolleyi]|uniref:Clr5 domain-containing protein n=1 Tax=Microdochium bolleyi TaxID=196109 RepID=A0A136IQY0_9PEZI|nr:hypothetical protein Micbo1qcDRAFT_208344 [Microdochium bolleyi]
MSDTAHPATDDKAIWEHHRETIRNLYLARNKSLSQLKTILEENHNFPPFSLSVYESRVRDTLGLRKKLKAEDWAAIWAHSRKIKDQGGTPTIFFNGVQIPWVKAWKEIRRHVTRRDSAPSGDGAVLGRRPSHSRVTPYINTRL